MVRTHDRDDFELFVARMRPRIRRTAYRLCRDWHAADDLTQATLWRIYRQWHRLGDRELLNVYAHRVLTSVLAGELRRAWRRWEAQTPIPDTPSPDDGAVENRELIASALRRIGPRQRAVVVLRFWEDLSVEETARILGCTPGTVKSQTSRALAVLRDLLRTEVAAAD